MIWELQDVKIILIMDKTRINHKIELTYGYDPINWKLEKNKPKCEISRESSWEGSTWNIFTCIVHIMIDMGIFNHIHVSKLKRCFLKLNNFCHFSIHSWDGSKSKMLAMMTKVQVPSSIHDKQFDKIISVLVFLISNTLAVSQDSYRVARLARD